MASWTHAHSLLLAEAVLAAFGLSRAEPQLPSPPMSVPDVRGPANFSDCVWPTIGHGGSVNEPDNPIRCRPLMTSDIASADDGASRLSTYLSARPVTPFEFGATLSQCDGVTDISAAVQAAVSTGADVYFPRAPGVCVFGDVTITGRQSVYSHVAAVKVRPGSDRLFKLTGWTPSLRGLNIQDGGGATRQGTLTVAANGGATKLSVSAAVDGGVWKVGQRVAVRLDSGSWHTTWITAVSGSVAPYTLTLRDAMRTAAAVGARVWATFGLVHLIATKNADVRDLTITNSWGSISLDDPSGATGGVTQATIANIRDQGGYVFSLIKGRNASVNTIRDVTSFGGWAVALMATGDGSTTTFSLSDPVYLTREMSVKIGGVAKMAGTDYTIAADGLSITFATAPASGASISASFWTYGADGYVEDGRDTASNAATGGNFVINSNFLQYRRCGFLKGAQLYSINGQFDTCSEAALLADGTTQTGQIGGFLGWAPVSLRLTNNALGVRLVGPTINPTGAGYQVAGGAGSEIIADAGSVLMGVAFMRDGSYQAFGGTASPAIQATSSGQIKWGGGTLSYNGSDTLTFAGSGYVYGAMRATLQSGANQMACRATSGCSATGAFSFGTPPSGVLSYLPGDTTSGNVAAGQTRYLGPGGASASGGWIIPAACSVVDWSVQLAAAPGAAESYTYQLFYDGAAVGAPVTVSGTSSFVTGVQAATLSLFSTKTLSIRVIASASAVPGLQRYYIRIKC